MNEGTSREDAPDAGEAAVLDARGAAVIMQQARERAGRELVVRRPVLFTAWGLVVLAGYGAMWLSVRGQHPYQGPAWPTLLLAFLLFAAVAGATANVVDRAASGITGRSELQRGIFVLALAAGFAALEVERQALAHAGASQLLVSQFGEAIPLLVAGLVFVASCAAAGGGLNWPRLAIGGWLLAVAAGGGWAGQAASLAVYALAGGGGILLMAVIEPRMRRS
ncbi:MAG TPA: hypothetical protein VH637_16120 [Streptosporangiaceae bacterium]|jgi:hypothetical protein